MSRAPRFRRLASAWCVTWALGLGPAAAPATPATAAKTTPAAPTRKPAGTIPRKTPASARPVAPTPARPAADVAKDARLAEDHGAYGHAAELLRSLRSRTPPDADLDLALAIDEARAGSLDSALTRLGSPLLRAAESDSMPPVRRVEYGWNRELHWLDGGFGGWHWYVVRARAEVLAAMNRWPLALEAARLAVAARPMSGKDWLVLAVCAGRAGQAAIGEAAAIEAVRLDPTLPEAEYLSGVYAWRSGRRHDAVTHFTRATALDSLYEPAVRARQRLLFFPSATADTLPTELLTGARRLALLTSPDGPKTEEFHQMESPARFKSHEFPTFVDSAFAGQPPLQIVMQVLVDERGQAAVHELPWFTPAQIPPAALARALGAVPGWRFEPATLHGERRRSWVSLQVTFKPS